MTICARCGEENPDRARFCLACAAPLAEASPQQAERKVVSVIFVDLVGFTAGADAADPEDVHATLQPYHARVGEAMVAGDVVNTASRLQSAAETGTLVVGDLTYRTTRQQIDYEPLDPVSVKGVGADDALARPGAAQPLRRRRRDRRLHPARRPR